MLRSFVIVSYCLALNSCRVSIDPEKSPSNTGSLEPLTIGQAYTSIDHLKGQVLLRIRPGKESSALQQIQDIGGSIIDSLGNLKLVSTNKPLTPLIDELNNSENFLRAQPNFIYKKEISTPLKLVGSPTSDQNYNPLQWGHKLIELDQAHKITRGEKSVKVMVLDTGLDYNHENIQQSLWINSGETASSISEINSKIDNLDNDSNGYIDDFFGIDTGASPMNGWPMDKDSHGSHVAGIIGGQLFQNKGISGVAPNISLVGCSAYVIESNPDDNHFTSMAQAKCLEYALNQKVDIVNMSLGRKPIPNIIFSALPNCELARYSV